MNKADLIQKVAERANIAHKKAEIVVETIFTSMTDALQKDDRIEIRGFGSFVNRDYEAYTGRNPRTGDPIAVKPKKLPYFKPGKELRERVDR
ncbi:HU family DNA-binding protein [Bdellovibrionota bacterium]